MLEPPPDANKVLDFGTDKIKESRKCLAQGYPYSRQGVAQTCR